MEGFLTTQEAAKKWGVSSVWVTVLCKQGRIPGATKSGKRWLLPADTQKPQDRRQKQSDSEAQWSFRFIDLFAGIGGFHQAMKRLGGKCVMASEINQACVATYNANFATEEGEVRGDINTVDPESIAPFDVLCAGFPCQSFSKAGLQMGFKDPKRGNLFYSIMRILDAHPEVQFIVLENVRNLADKKDNWSVVTSELASRDFIITKEPLILSPSDFGLPQIRERVYILGIKRANCNKEIAKKGYIDKGDLHISNYLRQCKIGDALRILEHEQAGQYNVTEEQALMIDAWDEFRLGTDIKIIGFPIWIHCFGYNIKDDEELRNQLGYSDMPKWKQSFVDRNRQFYKDHKEFIDAWIKKYDMFHRIKLYQKFEWNCGTDVSDIHDAIIQIRQSGIRVKRSNYFPSLVAIVNTPIIWDQNRSEYRHISPREAANLQNFAEDFKFIGTDKQVYGQLGNSVNVRVLEILCENLFRFRVEG